MNEFLVADLFCGAGGTSTGCLKAAERLGVPVRILAVNHWDIAIRTHSTNHPGMEHRCENLDGVNPRKAVPGGRLNLLLASPECIHHSRARGGKPMNDQSRATAWHILRWAEALYIDHIIVENVREFKEWGPLGANGKPIKSKKGVLYRKFISNLRALGYTVEDRILNAAQYGDATSRHRLFIQARRGRKPIVWPTPTHLPPESMDLVEGAQPYRPAREIIDWDLKGESIFSRKKPLSPNTMRRIMVGLQKFSGLPFVLPHQHGSSGDNNVRSLDNPLPTITASSSDMFLAEPYLVVLRNNCDALPVDGPLPTVCASGTHIGICEPFIVQGNEGIDRRCKSLDDPLPTITATGGKLYLVEPYLVEYHGGEDGEKRSRSLDDPLPTVDCSNRFGLCEPFLVNMKGQSNACDIDQPVPTITAGAPHVYLAEPFLTKYYGTGNCVASVDDPIGTITARDRFGLVTPIIVQTSDGPAYLDIRFRMLQPHELAAAMGFPQDYQFAGNRDDMVRQIGNAVPVHLAAALCETALSQQMHTYARAA